ncbi:hypothetical protein BCR36DRAFT_69915 [Piromyces finnis]|uniref:Uncharacterized protein n=1 Tax=Piromyces finnis TaxID=1754191 RepID=A0A1Y1V8A9_9FUNG|nr:hypothetical protein BCR36DRAFT_69915 [Piromyces finnis]|eukprot:ORX48933.1 hypothetical protein BCR36DRAFT_69915 [Piromyces finnis]
MKICKEKLMNLKKISYGFRSRNFFFCRDLNDFAKKLNEDSKYDNDKILKSINISLKSINDILIHPFNVESGYNQMITQIDKHYFGIKDNNHKYVTGRNYDILNYENVNDFDKLNGPQRTAVKNIIYESPLYLDNLNTDKNSPYVYLDKTFSDFKDIVLKKTEPIISEYSDLFNKLNPNVYVIVSKKYMINNKEREVDFENEKVYYINSNGKLVVIGKEETNKKNKTETNTNFKKIKDYLTPKNITTVYIVQTKKEKNLNSSLGNRNFFVVYSDYNCKIEKTDSEG